METRAGYVMVGTFVLLMIAGILTFFLWIAKTDFDYKVKYYTIYFSGSVTGLTLGGPVNYLGVPVGTVKSIKLDFDTPDRVNVLVGLKDNISIHEGTFASLEMQGLTGYKFVQISGGSKDSPLLKAKKGEPYPVIPSRYSGVEEIMTTLPRMVNKFSNLIDRVNTTFNEENRNRISDSLKNIDILAKNLAEESGGPLKDFIKDTTIAMNTFDKEIQKIGRSTESALIQVEGAAKDLHQLLEENRIALDSLTQSGSYEILQTLNDTRDMVTTAKQFFEKLDQNPQSLFFDSQRKGVSVPRQ